MPEYIEREVVQKSIADEQAVNHVSCGNAGYEVGYHNGLSIAMAMVIKAPAADVVEVVRCKDCKRGEVDDPEYDPDLYYCELGCGWNKGYFFCAYGKRRSDDEGQSTQEADL